jgi:hypothetical protein
MQEDLLFMMDAGSARSYSGSGTTVTNIIDGSTGTLTNGVVFNSANGGHWQFDGTNDHISIPNASSPQFVADQNFTISYVINLDRVTGTYMAPVMIGSFGSSYGHLIGSSNYLLIYTDNDNSPEFSVSNALDNDINKWVSITQTYDGNRIYVYRNGVYVNQSGTGVSFTINTSNSLNLASMGGGSYFLDGDIASVKMYNKALTATDILQNYNAQKNRFI